MEIDVEKVKTFVLKKKGTDISKTFVEATDEIEYHHNNTFIIPVTVTISSGQTRVYDVDATGETVTGIIRRPGNFSTEMEARMRVVPSANGKLTIKNVSNGSGSLTGNAIVEYITKTIKTVQTVEIKTSITTGLNWYTPKIVPAGGLVLSGYVMNNITNARIANLTVNGDNINNAVIQEINGANAIYSDITVVCRVLKD